MKAQTLRKVRQFHNYIAIFFAPAILFFAFTGWLQTAGFTDKHQGFAPPHWIMTIASLHKHQTLGKPARGGGQHAGGDHRPGDAPATAPPAGVDDHVEDFVPEKAFVIFLAMALFATTTLGMVIALATPSTRRLSLVLIAAGIVVPLALLL